MEGVRRDCGGRGVADGQQLWRRDTTVPGEGYVMDWQSPAADDARVYYFTGGNLMVMSRADGSIISKMRNPYFSKFGLSYFGTYDASPILDGTGRVITFSDNYQRGQSLPLPGWSATGTAPLWRTQAAYTGHPALRGDRLYAARHRRHHRRDRRRERECRVVDFARCGQG